MLRSRRRISLRETEELAPGSTDTDTAPPRRGGTYRTEQGFDFTSGAVTDSPPATPRPRPVPSPHPPPRSSRAPAAPPSTETRPTTAGGPNRRSGSASRPADTRPADTRPADTRPATPAPQTRRPGRHRDAAAPHRPAAPASGHRRPAAPAPVEPATPSRRRGLRPARLRPARRRPARQPHRPQPPPSGRRAAPRPSRPPPTGAGPLDRAAAGRAARPGLDRTPGGHRPRRAHHPEPPGSPQAWTEPPAVTTAPQSSNGADRHRPPRPAPAEQIEPAEGRLERLRGRLARSRSGFGQGLLGLLGAGELDEDSWEDVEAMLLQADLGPEMTIEITAKLRTELARRAVRTPEQARQLLRDVLSEALRPELDRSVRALPHDGRPGVLLVVGVNGTGKTTTTGKLARVLVAGGRHVVLGAADTFRAAAAEQLATWGERAGATVVRGPEGADPASVAFDAVKQGAEEGADVVLLDTAGRLHTKTGLMDELGKVKRVVERQAEVDEVLLVLDATTGQNGLTQARVFGDVVKVTGIVLTKLDGTAKGGIVFRVQRELGVPVKLVGLGEGADDLAPFVPAAFVDALLD